MRKKIFLLIALCSLSAASALAGDGDRQWGVQATIGGTEMNSSGTATGEDQGNAYSLSADWYVSRHVALTGGLSAEHTGIMTYLDADGLGPRSFNTLGLMAGAKLYPLPAKWALQPYLGAAIHTNVLNLGHHKGSVNFLSNYGEAASMDYDVSCAPVSLAPQLGLDIRLLSSLSLVLAADYRFGLGGKTKATARITSGQQAGSVLTLDERHNRTCFSIGLKMDFPVRQVSGERVRNNLLSLLMIWLSGK